MLIRRQYEAKGLITYLCCMKGESIYNNFKSLFIFVYCFVLAEVGSGAIDDPRFILLKVAELAWENQRAQP